MIFFKQTNKQTNKQNECKTGNQEMIIIFNNLQLFYYIIDCILCIYLFIKYVFRKHANLWKHQKLCVIFEVWCYFRGHFCKIIFFW